MADEAVIEELKQQFQTEATTPQDIEDAMLNKLGIHGDGTRPFAELAESLLQSVKRQSVNEQVESLSMLCRPLGEAVWVLEEDTELSVSYRKALEGFAILSQKLLGSEELKQLPKEKSFRAAASCLSIMAANAGHESLGNMLLYSNVEIRCSNGDCSEYGGSEIKCAKCGSYSSPDSMFINL